MSPQETQVLQTFLEQLIQVKGVSKDEQAQALIAQSVARQPDAAYLLVQRALLLEQALATAQQQIAQQQAELARLQATTSPQNSGGFLDAPSTAWGNSAVSRPLAPLSSPTPVMTAMTASYAPAPMNQVAAQPGFLGGNTGGMLGTMAATAAGVAAGAFLFQGIGSLMGQHHAGAGNTAQGLDSAGASAAPANANNADNGLIKDYFAEDPAAQADSGSDGGGEDTFDNADGGDVA
ncbi:MAG: DUF2076 family protein [Pseudomonadota bacterium]